jgi:hypothetical protein
MISLEMLERLPGRDKVIFANIALDFLNAELESRGHSELIPLVESVVYYYTVEASDPEQWLERAGAQMSTTIHTLDMQQALNKIQNKIINLMPRLSQGEYSIPLN